MCGKNRSSGHSVSHVINSLIDTLHRVLAVSAFYKRSLESPWRKELVGYTL